ncbi:Pyruvate phosphate dikinase, PEP/pyruvate binding domain [Hathewaya proteolytica DSM 3090]|uniref:Pyruvate phosphate dikinase, PEP/pyruvate binding domain n=1 Tax=Hathewaya proteolytica DSM 3090 TaxID=1121331 RepID=A0A1M6K5G6_9CLOT|nr:PEP/pyruvate-binding domain-containing protein [Hathewaya proteolytica]SHJ54214.1 Pyruvate phosphate dikinase, PEP/pyruvate binding domain [Hathewaya proteolytica DSM 3090]
MRIYNIRDIISEKVEPQIIGNKAYGLGILSNKNIKIADGFVIPVDFFYECVKYNNAEKYLKNIKDKNNVSQFREIIKTFIIPKKIWSIIEENTTQIGYPVIARSSSTNEDCANSTMAGMYLSIGEINTLEHLKNSILDVWASAYYNYFSINTPIAIIIQRYFKSELGGVIFSKHPIGKDCYYGEYSMKGAEDVVDGKCNYSFEITEGNNLVNSDSYLKNYSNELGNIVKKIKEYFQCEVDIEWLIYKTQIVVLQARPITTYIHKKNINKFCIIDVDDRETLCTVDMSKFYSKYMKWFDKRDRLRKICINNNIDIPIVKYVFYNNDNLDLNQLYSVFKRAKILKIENNDKVRTRKKEELGTYLREICSTPCHNINIVRIQEITSTEYCGNACMTNEGYIYIECMPGGFGGFLSGELDFSKYLIDSEGNILSENILIYNYIWKIDQRTGRFVKSKLNNGMTGSINDFLIKKVVYMVQVLNKVYKNIKIEFETEGENVFFNDATFEKKSVSSDNISYGILSTGDFYGKVDIISEDTIKLLKEEVGSRSVIAESEFINKSRKYLEHIHINNGQKKVMVAPYPDPCLSALVDCYEGFIFERGGLLSHMAIILREKRKPAIIKKDLGELKNGVYVEIKDGMVKILKGDKGENAPEGTIIGIRE